ncbi:Fasciclin-2 [Halotydeus destructor]|nr:Fasciclin-2 [Halotydeus destructor]
MPYESAPEKVPITLQDSVILPESGDVMSPSSREYLLQWREPVDNGRPIQEYKLKFYRVVRSDEGWRQVGTEKTEVLKDRNQFFYYRIQGLDSDSFYKLELSANNAKGDSEPAYLVFKTAKGDPRSEKHTNGASGLTAAIFLIILALIVLLVIVDLVFYVRYRSGALFYLKNEFCASSKNLNDDAKEKQQMNANAAVANSNGTEV